MFEEIASYIFIGLAFAGLLITWLGWRARRNTSGRWCPACQEDLSKDLSRTCSSCGFSSPDEVMFHLPRPRWGIVIIGLSVVSLASVLSIRDDFSGSVQDFIGPAWALEERVELPGGWVAEIHRSNDLQRTGLDRRVRVIGDGKTRFEWMGWFVRFGTEDPTTGARVLLLSLATRSGVYRIETRAILPEGWFMAPDGDSQRRFHVIDQVIDDGWGLSGFVSKPTLVLASGPKSIWSVDFDATRAQAMPSSMSEFDSTTIVEASFEAWRAGADPELGRLLSFATHLLYRGRIDEARAVLGAEWPGDDDSERLKLFMSGSHDSGFINYRPDPAWRLEAFKSAIEASPRRIEFQEMARIGSPSPKR